MLFDKKTKTNVFNVSGNKSGAPKMGKGGQALFDALKAKGYKKMGGSSMKSKGYNKMGGSSMEAYKCGGSYKLLPGLSKKMK